MASKYTLEKRQLPKLLACMTKNSLENLRNQTLFTLDVLDAKGIRRRRFPLFECLILELKESGYVESSSYLQDLIYDNIQLVAEDDIGIVVDIRKRPDYLEHVCMGLQEAEKYRDRENTKKECLALLKLAMHYAEREKGILWLAEKFFMASIAVSSQYLIDGGRQKACCKFHYAKFLLDKFPGADPEEAFVILTEVRDSAIGKYRGLNTRVLLQILDVPCLIFKPRHIASKQELFSNRELGRQFQKTWFPNGVKRRLDSGGFRWRLNACHDWRLYEAEQEGDVVPPDTVFCATALQLHKVLLSKARAVRKQDPSKAERLSRLAERRANDAGETAKTAEAIIEIGICQLMMNNLNNAQKTFERAFKIHEDSKNTVGLCETRMHLAAVMQRLGEHETAARLLTEMGAMAMDNNLRWQLGRALHLLGELHLRRERPDLGTPHLAEAFACFMGHKFQGFPQSDTMLQKGEDINEIYISRQKETYIEEAEQSRFMTSISAGQELMAAYFNLIREAGICSVAQMKIIEWKLSRAGWWVKMRHHDLLPCLCPVHHRTPLDVLRIQMESKSSKMFTESTVLGGRTDTIEDIRRLRSSYQSNI